MRFYTPTKKCKLDSPWIGPYLVVSLIGWAIGIQKAPESPIVIVHCQDIKKIPPPPGAVSWLNTKKVSSTPSVMILGASTMQRILPSSLSITVAPPVEETLIAEVESDLISDFCSTNSGEPRSGDRFIVCDTSVLYTQNGFGTGENYDHSSCI